jgi:ribosome biogenesis GTPase A
LVEYRDVLKWIDFFKRNGKACLPASNMGKHDTQNIISKLTEINTKTIEKYKARGISKTIRAMVIGVPNTGKSTIINCLTGGKKTATGNIPGVTRGKQWVVVNKYTELMDSPGVLYPDFKNQFKAIKLALIGSIKDDIIDTVELATEGIKLLTKIAPSMLESKYAINKTENSPISILEQICKHRGCILRGGELDLDRGGAAFINDFRKGLIGKIILDEIPIR